MKLLPILTRRTAKWDDAQAKELAEFSFAGASGLCAKTIRRDFAVLLLFSPAYAREYNGSIKTRKFRAYRVQFPEKDHVRKNMTVAILPVPGEEGELPFHAVSGGKSSLGRTRGEALDAISAQMADEQDGTFVVVQSFRPDRYFSASQQRRLAELMGRWSLAGQQGGGLSDSGQAELEALIAIEVRAARQRAAALADELRR
jgi:hypothetical protein